MSKEKHDKMTPDEIKRAICSLKHKIHLYIENTLCWFSTQEKLFNNMLIEVGVCYDLGKIPHEERKIAEINRDYKILLRAIELLKEKTEKETNFSGPFVDMILSKIDHILFLIDVFCKKFNSIVNKVEGAI